MADLKRVNEAIFELGDYIARQAEMTALDRAGMLQKLLAIAVAIALPEDAMAGEQTITIAGQARITFYPREAAIRINNGDQTTKVFGPTGVFTLKPGGSVTIP